MKFVGLLDAEDYDIWQFAKANDYTIITFDADFYELQTIKGFPPPIIWLRFGNMTRLEFIDFFQNNAEVIKDYLSSEEFKDIGCLEFK
ncbi:DUF5615 family PIN-like protein [Catalinimonas niigatensis]|nr:DUF5615 family PIN-like protein [Catalinimonas niigatensis]WPP49855.1 DUF5615 family PIN-like protein [Catalinimonas niigatensis]